MEEVVRERKESEKMLREGIELAQEKVWGERRREEGEICCRKNGEKSK